MVEGVMVRAALLIGVLVPALVEAQPRTARIPPLPQAERFVPRGGVSVTLRISPARVRVDEVPTFTIVVRNIGTTRVLVLPAVASHLRVFDHEGGFVSARRHAIADYGLRTIRARDLIPLEPGTTHEFAAVPEYHHPNDFSRVGMYTRTYAPDPGVGMGLAPGSYAVRFGYYALQGYGATTYEGSMPAALWEGSIETEPVPLTVLPLEGARLTKAIADIDGPAPAAALAELSVLARSPQIIDAWLRRFERNPGERSAVVNVVREIGDSDGITRVLDLVAALPERERQQVIEASGPLLGRDAPGCLGVPWLVQVLNNNVGYPTGIEDVYRPVAERCPELLTEVRAIARSPIQVRNGGSDAYAHGKYLELLGRLGDRRDVPLLMAMVNGDVPGARPSANDAMALRAGAMRGLASVGGEEAARALLDQLRLVGSDRVSAFDTLMIAPRLPLPAAVPILIDLLGSTNTTVVTFAVRALQMRGDRAAIPAIERLLSRPDRYVRQSAANALQTAGDEVSLPLMRRLAADGNPDVRAMALHHLARRGTASDLPLLIEGMSTRVWEPALEGIDRLGTAATFLLLKAKIDTADRELRPFFMRALQRLTFEPLAWEAAEWDSWWATHSSSTRADWAREALAQADSGERTYLASVALEFLSRTGALPTQALDAATVHRNLAVRRTAARIIGESDRPRAVLLLTRELDNRSVSACQGAIIEINALLSRNEDLDCTNFGERAAARRRWTTLAANLR